ncbi:MAG: calcium/sodium antiporter [Tepidisphaerales bacterium]
MLLAILLLAIGLAMVIYGGDVFVRAAVRIAEWLRLPRVVIGGTLMSLATTSPEVAVSLTASLRNEPGLAVGNAVGSVICNFALIGALGALISPYRIKRKEVALLLGLLLLICVAFFIMTRGEALLRWEAAIMLALGAGYFIGDFVVSMLKREALERDADGNVIGEIPTPWLHWLLFFVGAAIVIAGSRLLVDNASTLAAKMGISSLAIGLTIVAVGTSLPELVTAIISARKGVSDLSVGNLIGANVANLTLVAGSAGAVTAIPVTRLDNVLNFPVMFAVVGFFAFMLLVLGRNNRVSGGFMLAGYVAYVVTLLTLAKQGF